MVIFFSFPSGTPLSALTGVNKDGSSTVGLEALVSGRLQIRENEDRGEREERGNGVIVADDHPPETRYFL